MLILQYYYDRKDIIAKFILIHQLVDKMHQSIEKIGKIKRLILRVESQNPHILITYLHSTAYNQSTKTASQK